MRQPTPTLEDTIEPLRQLAAGALVLVQTLFALLDVPANQPYRQELETRFYEALFAAQMAETLVFVLMGGPAPAIKPKARRAGKPRRSFLEKRTKKLSIRTTVRWVANPQRHLAPRLARPP